MCIRSQNLGNCTAKQVGKVLSNLQKNNKNIIKKRANSGYKYLLPVNISEAEKLVDQNLL